MISLRDLGLAIVRAAPWTESVGMRLYRALPPSLHDTPSSRARAFFRAEPHVTFIQIGAHDGIAGDPIRPLVLDHPGWTGVLLEPQADVFSQLLLNYKGAGARLHFLNAAISDRQGEQPLYFIPKEEIRRLNVSDWGSQIASFDPSHLSNHLPTARIAVQYAPVMTFAAAAKMLRDERVDLVVLDTEGHESTIIPTIDFDRHRVRFVIYEHNHLNSHDHERIGGILRYHGFNSKVLGRDTIAWRLTVPAI
jgi:FkbM family methyltransferase